ncbi:unnamed protein product, partial [Protopolystoma xenopodis]
PCGQQAEVDGLCPVAGPGKPTLRVDTPAALDFNCLLCSMPCQNSAPDNMPNLGPVNVVATHAQPLFSLLELRPLRGHSLSP